MEQITSQPSSFLLISFTPVEMAINVMLSLVLGFALAFVYRYTHKGLSYSQSFTHTIIFVTLIVAIVMMVIGGSLTRAFALVGAMSIIRFRTVLKDTKDIAYVFGGLALGMAAGTSNYVLAGIGLVSIALVANILNITNFGSLYKSEFILRFRFNQDGDSSGFLRAMDEDCKRSNLLHVEPSGDGQNILQTFDIAMKDEKSHEALVQKLSQLPDVSEIALIASKNDADY